MRGQMPVKLEQTDPPDESTISWSQIVEQFDTSGLAAMKVVLDGADASRSREGVRDLLMQAIYRRFDTRAIRNTPIRVRVRGEDVFLVRV